MSILFSSNCYDKRGSLCSIVSKNTLIKKYSKESYDSIRYHIILGDARFGCPGNDRTDRSIYEKLACRPFPVLCVIGDNDPIPVMKSFPEVDIGIGETVYKINNKPFAAYLKRGKVYIIDGLRFLVLGGALSPEKEKKIQNKTWCENEYWSEQEKKDLFKLLETENNFDMVISHTGAEFMNSLLYKTSNANDEVALLNNEIHGKIKYKAWWCGHFHKDKYYHDEKTDCGYHYSRERTALLEMV